MDSGDSDDEVEDDGPIERDWILDPDYNSLEGEEREDNLEFESVKPVLSKKVCDILM